jgi:WD40 repeat protein/serine/threonine protein kinase
MADDATLDPVGQLAEDFAARYRRGLRPSVTEYAEKHPDLAERLHQVLPIVAMMEEAGSADATLSATSRGPSADMPQRLGGYRILREIGRGGMGIVYEAEQIALGRHVALKVLPLSSARAGGLDRFRREARAAARLHHTNIVPVFEVGEEGDLGYYAMQFIQGQPLDQVLEELRRLQIKGDAGSTDPVSPHSQSTIARSLLEQGVPGRPPGGLMAPPAAAAGQPDELVAQRETATLAADNTVRSTAAVASLPGRTDPSSVSLGPRRYHRSVAHVGIQVAEALDYAHREGVIHRDIKPANLLLDADGRVWVTDFGLAKTEGTALTGSGDLIGTLRYMAPERFRGWSDPRSDSYSLGLTLYEMLLLRPAFDEEDRFLLLQQILGSAPPRLRKIDPRIPRDLETIIVKSIDKEPGRRYQTAGELAADLQRFLEDRPIQARQIGSLERVRRWCRRNPTIAGLLAAVALVTVVGIAGVLWQWQEALANAKLAAGNAAKFAIKTQQAQQLAVQAQDLAQEAQRERDETQTANQRLRRANYTADMILSRLAWDISDVRRVRDLLDLHRPGPSETDLRGFEWHYLDRLCRQRLLFVKECAAPVVQVAVSPDGTRIAAGLQDGSVTIFDSHTGEPALKPTRVYQSRVRGMAFSPDGHHLAITGGRWLRVLDAESGRMLFQREAPAGPWGVAFRPDGKVLACGWGDGTVRISSLENERESFTLAGNGAGMSDVAFSPNGEFLAAGSRDGTVLLWNAQTWEKLDLAAFESGRGAVLSVAFDATSQWLAAGGTIGMVQLWNVRSGNPAVEKPLQLSGAVQSVAFSPDGKRLATVGGQQTIHLFDTQTAKPFDATTGKALPVWRAHSSLIQKLAFSPDGSRLISGGADGAVRIWSTQETKESIPIGKGHTRWHVAVSPDGSLLACTDVGGKVALWDARTLSVVRMLEGPPAQVHAVAFSLDNQRLAAGFGDGQVFIWDIQGEHSPLKLPARDSHQVMSVAFSPDGKLLATGARDRTSQHSDNLRLWDASTGEPVSTLGGQSPNLGHTAAVISVAFSPDGQRLASGSTDQTARLWDVAARREVSPLRARHADDVRSVAFSNDGKRLASASYDGTVQIRDLDSGQTVKLEGHTGQVTCVCFSRDGSRVATASSDQTIKVWDGQTGQELLTLRGHAGSVTCVAFSADGHRLFSLSADRTLRVWDGTPLP